MMSEELNWTEIFHISLEANYLPINLWENCNPCDCIETEFDLLPVCQLLLHLYNQLLNSMFCILLISNLPPKKLDNADKTSGFSFYKVASLSLYIFTIYYSDIDLIEIILKWLLKSTYLANWWYNLNPCSYYCSIILTCYFLFNFYYYFYYYYYFNVFVDYYQHIWLIYES